MRYWLWLSLVLFLLVSEISAASESGQLVREFGGAGREFGDVNGRIFIYEKDGGSFLRVELEPIDGINKTFHLYGLTGSGEQPVATELSLEELEVAGPIVADQVVHTDNMGSAIFPAGLVSLHIPIIRPTEEIEAALIATYMVCNDQTCKPPVMNLRVPFTLSDESEHIEDKEDKQQEERLTEQKPIQEPTQLNVSDVFIPETPASSWPAALPAVEEHNGINWRKPQQIEEVEALIAAAQAQGTLALLDFTGPFCPNCQSMAKTVFQRPDVQTAWNSGMAIELDTDTHTVFGEWQRRQFGTYTRPFYVAILPDGRWQGWAEVFSETDEERSADFVAFLQGGDGVTIETGSTWWQFMINALLGGLITLLMPCTYPMIPMTINFFTKQSSDGRKLMPLAAAYSAGIMLFFTAIGLIMSFVLERAVTDFAGNVWVNLVIAVLFLVLGLSLLGVFFLRLPHQIQSKFGSGSGGYIGALLMGLTFGITAFTCTAPIAGAILAEGVNQGDPLRATLGMLVYSSAIALPFFFLSMSPKAMQKMPNAGSWMNEIKHVGGLIEIAASLKFFAGVSYVWGWGIFNRTSLLASWTIILAISAIYLSGKIRMPSDSPIHKLSLVRILFIVLFAAGAVWMASGLAGYHLGGIIESFFPDPADTPAL